MTHVNRNRGVRSRSVVFASIWEAQPLEKRCLLSAALSTISTTPDTTGVSSQLLQLASAASSGKTAAKVSLNSAGEISAVGSVSVSPLFMFDSSDRIGVHITAENVATLTSSLGQLGFITTASEPSLHFIDGYIPLSAITNINTLTSKGLLGVQPLYKPQVSAGLVDSQGDDILEADRTRIASGFDGTGVTVGVLSDSYNNLGTASNDVASGDLPNNVNVLEDDAGGGTDEGRAMMQIVHDLAPGANLAFATADFGEAAFAQNIENLAKPVAQGGGGANVIVDDAYYYDEPFFQDGVIGQAINDVVANQNVSYFSAAGNFDTQAYQSTNINFYSDTIAGISASAASYYNFNPTGTANDRQAFTLAGNGYSGDGVTITLQWDQPYYTSNGVTTNLTLYVVDATTGAVVQSSTDNAIANQTPVQILDFENPNSSSHTYDLVIQKSAGTTPGEIKWQNYGSNEYGDVTFQYATNSPTIVSHAAAANAMAVAAAGFYQQRTPESFTSAGPATILFDATGNRLTTAQTRSKPDIMATDGGDTTFFGGDIDGNGYDNFFGTSAAAPHAAAVAALVKQAHPTWTPAQIYSDLKTSADPTNGNTTNSANFVGAGLIDAYRAIVGTPTVATQPVSDGFESGVLSQNWQTYDTGTGRSVVLPGNSPSSGSYQLIEDGNLDAFVLSNLSESTLNVNLAGASNISLSFDFKSFTNIYQTNHNMPTSFTGHGNYNGVALSVDGVTWYSLQNLAVATSTYTTYTLNLNSFATAHGLTLSADTRIKFQHYDPDTFTAPDGGFAFDNIHVGAAASPLALNGPAFYLKLDNSNPSAPVLDVWNNTTGSGSPSQTVLLSTISSLSVTGTAAADSLIISFANGDPLPASGLSFVGGSGANSLGLIDDNSGDTVSLDASTATFTSPAFGPVTIAYSASGTTAVTNTGGSGNDSFTQSAALAMQPVFAGGSGSDTLNINAGTYTFNADANATTTSLTVNVAAGASTTFNATQHLAGLNLTGGSATLTATGGKVLVTRLLSITNSGALNLNDNDMIVDYTGSSPIGTWNGSAYTGIDGLIQTGRNSAAWNGPGLDSTNAGASGGLTALGIAEASSIFSISDAQTATFDGQVVDATAVLVKYTYAGDANLDGRLNGDDYFAIDSHVNQNGSVFGWINGDFNYDGHINGDDYFLIDSNINQQSQGIL